MTLEAGSAYLLEITSQASGEALGDLECDIWHDWPSSLFTMCRKA